MSKPKNSSACPDCVKIGEHCKNESCKDCWDKCLKLNTIKKEKHLKESDIKIIQL